MDGLVLMSECYDLVRIYRVSDVDDTKRLSRFGGTYFKAGSTKKVSEDQGIGKKSAL